MLYFDPAACLYPWLLAATIYQMNMKIYMMTWSTPYVVNCR